MSLGTYFDGAKGQGVLATADGSGRVDAAVFARPHFMDDNTALFIMAERLTHENLNSNPWAAYIFIEAGEGWTGKRLYLRKIKEEQNEPLIGEICRRCDYSRYDVKNRYVVYFKVEKVLPLIGGE
ncbi:MAG: pyridoxamine 5'-phosphate oxidase family protein [Deltaproteobacteria bacterium]|nr:pyridoxamine 5'-phosphate oxidase family protein [Deltaproteobacteria bacterium]